MVRGGDGHQQRWRRTFPFASSMILPFDEEEKTEEKLEKKKLPELADIDIMVETKDDVEFDLLKLKNVFLLYVKFFLFFL